jgi:hypothetical protein
MEWWPMRPYVHPTYRFLNLKVPYRQGLDTRPYKGFIEGVRIEGVPRDRAPVRTDNPYVPSAPLTVR